LTPSGSHLATVDSIRRAPRMQLNLFVVFSDSFRY
jgi:hypothetical protein